MKPTPFFKSHYSIGRSILTLRESGTTEPEEADSIFDICLANKISELFLVEDELTGLLEANANAKEAKVNLRFGWRVTMVDDMAQKTEDSRLNEHKVVVFAKNDDAYKDFVKIATIASTEGFYYYPRIDEKTLKSLWSKNLRLVIPFYDSYLFKNTFTFAQCTPKLNFCEKVFCREDNSHIFDPIIQKKLDKNVPRKEQFFVKSVFYNKIADFKTYLAARCIQNRTTFDKPNIEHLCSDKFCVEAL